MTDYKKWRLLKESGSDFIDTYLERFSRREEPSDFTLRKSMTYCPAYSKTEVMKIAKAISSRMHNVSRLGGPIDYTSSCRGERNGVDGKSSSMDVLIGLHALPELLFMGKVAIVIDRDPDALDDPYAVIYTVENILDYAYGNNGELQAVKLKALKPKTDQYGFNESADHYELIYYMVDDLVMVKIGDDESTVMEGLTRIPVVIAEFCDDKGNSIASDVANHQIALLNLESSDVSYCCHSNFPFYTEQGTDLAPGLKRSNEDGTESTNTPAVEVQVGPMHGRRYGKGLDRPSFISPPSEPLEVSMKKQLEIRQQIRELLHLAVGRIASAYQSKESKGIENEPMEAGLSSIGQVLQKLETCIAQIWSEFLGSTEVTTVKYPKQYKLTSINEDLEEAEKRLKLMARVPSPTYQRVMAKQVINLTAAHNASSDELVQMTEEVDAAAILVTDPDVIKADHEAGFVGTDLASKLRGYPEGEAKRAADDHKERLVRIAMAQGAALDNSKDGKGNPAQDNKAEKTKSQAADNQDNGAKAVHK